MHINQLPLEILRQIFDLLKAPGPDQHPDAWCAHDLARARLVCARWAAIAAEHLFQRLIFRHNGPSGFESWHDMVNDRRVRRAARIVVVDTDLANLRENDRPTLTRWTQYGLYPALTDALRRVVDLDRPTTLHVAFDKDCTRPASYLNIHDVPVQSESFRASMLNAVFEAIGRRPPTSRITSLALINLENKPLLDFTLSATCKSVLQDLTQLTLHVVIDKGPDRVSHIKRLEFESYMQQRLLTPAAEHLTSLDLGFDEPWATAPGYFDGRGLELPSLASLRLHNYAVSHADHLDWVLGLGRTLRRLVLDDCYVVSHLALATSDVEQWRLPVHGWVRLDGGAFGFDRDSESVYVFEGTWADIFDGMAGRLASLVSFRVHYGEPRSPLAREASGLNPSRYIAFEQARDPLFWRRADPQTGEMSFGDNDPGVHARLGVKFKADPQLNVAAQNERRDSLALSNLLRVISERAWNV